jgi:hypothetical protein
MGKLKNAMEGPVEMPKNREEGAQMRIIERMRGTQSGVIVTVRKRTRDAQREAIDIVMWRMSGTQKETVDIVRERMRDIRREDIGTAKMMIEVRDGAVKTGGIEDRECKWDGWDRNGNVFVASRVERPPWDDWTFELRPLQCRRQPGHLLALRGDI